MSRRGRHVAPMVALLALLGAAEADAQRTRALVVVGLGGTAEYRESFHTLASTLVEALVDRHGLSPDDAIYLGERVETDPDLIRDRSTRDNVLAALEELGTSGGATDRILVVLIGHGTSGRSGESFNLPGPDIGPQDLAAALDALGERQVAVVHTGSGSGAYLEPLSGPGRIVVTATRSGRELNATRFGEHFVAALSEDGADIDRDGAVSLLEAFIYARDEVRRYYESENQILTEHAVLDGDGDGEGTDEPTLDGPDGRGASAFVFGGNARAGVPETDDPTLRRLYGERAEIQGRIDELRALSGTMDEEVYFDRMEDLLVELALKNREIEAAGGGGR